MDTEKAFYPRPSFLTQEHLKPCNACRATHKKQYIFKSVVGFVLLGLLVLSAYYSAHTLHTGLSSLQLGQHYISSVEAHRQNTLPLVVEVLPTDDDAPWSFTVYTENGCQGNSTNVRGDGPIISCQPLNQPYNATSVLLLDETLKICYYGEAQCKTSTTQITTRNDCQNIPPSSSYRVISNITACELGSS